MNKAIEAQRLSYTYNGNKAVDRISFDVAEGEIVGFLGPNGAGKTTTIKMLTGQLKPQEGTALVLGRDVSKEPNQVQQHIGVGFESTNLYEQMTALENLNLFARLYGVKNFDGMALLGRVDLGGREKERVAAYSKGMKQRLMVARALVNTPRLLFLDEPTEGLDPVSSEVIRTIIREERHRGATVFLTTHDMIEADKLSDRVAFIHNGRIVALDTPHALKQQFGKRMLLAQVKGRDGGLATKELVMDEAGTAKAVHDLFKNEQVVTLHSEEASLEDIFIEITGRGLAG